MFTHNTNDHGHIARFGSSKASTSRKRRYNSRMCDNEKQDKNTTSQPIKSITCGSHSVCTIVPCPFRESRTITSALHRTHSFLSPFPAKTWTQYVSSTQYCFRPYPVPPSPEAKRRLKTVAQQTSIIKQFHRLTAASRYDGSSAWKTDNFLKCVRMVSNVQKLMPTDSGPFIKFMLSPLYRPPRSPSFK